MTFVRLYGCNLRCSFCDTSYSHTKGAAGTISVSELAYMARAANLECKSVCITGGEPMIQGESLPALVQALREVGFTFISIETNGTIFPAPGLLHFVDHWTVSPKIWPFDMLWFQEASEIKMVVSFALPGELLQSVLGTSTTVPIYLQPESNSKDAITFCLNAIKRKPSLRLSVQVHKLIDVR